MASNRASTEDCGEEKASPSSKREGPEDSKDEKGRSHCACMQVYIVTDIAGYRMCVHLIYQVLAWYSSECMPCMWPL